MQIYFDKILGKFRELDIGSISLEQARQAGNSISGNINANSNTIINLATPTNAGDAVRKDYVDSLVVGLLDDRGSYNASVNQFPTTGGSGTGGAVLKGDLWYISVGGTLGSKEVQTGDSVRALTDNPGQTATNWDILSVGLGYVPENTINKSTNTSLGTSDTLFPTQNAVKIYVDNIASSKEGVILSGTISQYFRGDKTWATLDKSAVGLSNVENTAISSWIGSLNITTLGTIGSGVWNGTIIEDSYIANALTNKSINGVTLSTGAGANNFLAGDGTYKSVSGFSWGASITGSSGTGETITVGGSNNTGLYIDTGSSYNYGIVIKSLRGDSANTGGLLVNWFSSVTQSSGAGYCVRIGKNYNTNAIDDALLIEIQNEQNAGGANTGFKLTNNSTQFQVGSKGMGALFYQVGAGGTALHVYGGNNVNSGTNGIVNFTLSGTQSGASIIHKIDTGGSAIGHTGLLINAGGNNTSQTGLSISMGSSGVGTALSSVYNTNARAFLVLSNDDRLSQGGVMGGSAIAKILINDSSIASGSSGLAVQISNNSPVSTKGINIFYGKQGATGSAIYITDGTNLANSTTGLVNYTLQNTQSSYSIVQKIDLGSSGVGQGHIGLLITGTSSGTSGPTANGYLTVNYNPSANSLSNAVLITGNNPFTAVSLNSNLYGNGATEAYGFLLSVGQTGGAGRPLAVFQRNNGITGVSGTGMVEIRLHNTQTGVSIGQITDLGTSAYAHIGNLTNLFNANTGAIGFKVDKSTTGTGYGFYITGGNGGYGGYIDHNTSTTSGGYGLYINVRRYYATGLYINMAQSTGGGSDGVCEFASSTTITGNGGGFKYMARIVETANQNRGIWISCPQEALTIDSGVVKIYTNTTISGTVSLSNANITIGSLPTSDPVSAGRIWNDSGVLKVSAG